MPLQACFFLGMHNFSHTRTRTCCHTPLPDAGRHPPQGTAFSVLPLPLLCRVCSLRQPGLRVGELICQLVAKLMRRRIVKHRICGRHKQWQAVNASSSKHTRESTDTHTTVGRMRDKANRQESNAPMPGTFGMWELTYTKRCIQQQKK